MRYNCLVLFDLIALILVLIYNLRFVNKFNFNFNNTIGLRYFFHERAIYQHIRVLPN